MNTLTTAAIATLTIVGSWIAAYYGAYFRQKGKNAATHDDIDKLKDQVAVVTQTTKEIEAKISGEVWDRQKQWEMKREVLFVLTKRVSAAFEALAKLENLVQTELKNPEYKGTPYWKEMKVARNEKWFDAVAALDESALFVGLSSGKQLVDAVGEYRSLMTVVAAKIFKDDAAIFNQSSKKIVELRGAVRDAIREELGVDSTAPSESNSAQQAARQQ